jgi:hypothetical protein
LCSIIECYVEKSPTAFLIVHYNEHTSQAIPMAGKAEFFE